jgi:hypothetical protein
MFLDGSLNLIGITNAKTRARRGHPHEGVTFTILEGVVAHITIVGLSFVLIGKNDFQSHLITDVAKVFTTILSFNLLSKFLLVFNVSVADIAKVLRRGKAIVGNLTQIRIKARHIHRNGLHPFENLHSLFFVFLGVGDAEVSTKDTFRHNLTSGSGFRGRNVAVLMNGSHSKLENSFKVEGTVVVRTTTIEVIGRVVFSGVIAGKEFHSLHKVIYILLKEIGEALSTNLKEFFTLAKNDGLRAVTLGLTVVTNGTSAEAFYIHAFHKGMNEVFIVVDHSDELIASLYLKLLEVRGKGEVNDIHHHLTIELRKGVLGKDVLHRHILFGSSIGNEGHTLLFKTLVQTLDFLGSIGERSEGEVHSLSPLLFR